MSRYTPLTVTAQQLREREQAIADASLLTTRCALCDWTYHGTALEGRELAKGHRRVHHPEAVQTRRRRNNLRNPTIRDGYREEGIARAQVVADALARLEATG